MSKQFDSDESKESRILQFVLGHEEKKIKDSWKRCPGCFPVFQLNQEAHSDECLGGEPMSSSESD